MRPEPQGQRARHHLCRRAQAVHGIFWNGCAARWSRPQRAGQGGGKMSLRNPAQETLHRLDAKTLDAQLRQILVAGLNCSPFEANAVIRLRESSTKKTGPQPAQRPGMDVTNSADGSPAKTGSCQRRSEQSPATRLKPHRNPHRTLALDSDLPSHGSPDRQGGVAAWTRGIRHRPRSPFGCGSSALGCLSLNCTKRNQAGTSWVESFPRVG